MSCDCWQALWTGAGALIVAWYAFETWRLRKVSQDQFEASIAPMLLFAHNRPDGYDSIVTLDLHDKKPGWGIEIYNAGKGPAILQHLSVQSRASETLKSAGMDERGRKYDLPPSPIPPSTSARIWIAEEDVCASGAIDIVSFEYEVFYTSTSRVKYRTYHRTKKGKSLDDTPLVEYGRVK